MTESERQSAVIDCARWLDWLVHHGRPGLTGKGWRTPIQGDPGFPDLALARGGRLLFVELKADRGRLSVAQEKWLAVLRATGAEVYVWKPADWTAGTIERVLRARRQVEPAA
jgi:hypothetical protein